MHLQNPRPFFGCLLVLFCVFTRSDSFIYNNFNNHGTVGLLNTPSARFFDEGSHGITIYDGSPDLKATFTASPYNWLEASFFYTRIDDLPYCGDLSDPVCNQSYKDKGFNFKLRLREEDNLPAIAIGAYDFAGTGYYSSEYIVASYGVGNLDMNFGLGWGNLNGSKFSFKNPLILIDDSFENRPIEIEDLGGQIQLSRYFSDEKVSPFFGLSFMLKKDLIFKLEHDPTLTPGNIGYSLPKNDYSYGFDYSFNSNFTLGFFHERGNTISMKFIYKRDLDEKSNYKFKKSSKNDITSSYEQLRKSLEKNKIGVNKIIKKDNFLGLEITQFQHDSEEVVEEIIYQASLESELKEEVVVNYRIANLTAIQNYSPNQEIGAETLYQRKAPKGWNTSSNLSFRPFLASREEFFKLGLFFENNSQYIFSEGFFFSSNLKYSLWDNFEDLTIPPRDTYPAQVRSDIKDYLKNINRTLVIGRAQFDYYKTLKKNNHIMLSGGILEDMFSGYGLEYLYYDDEKNYGLGFEIFEAYKRDYEQRFGLLDYNSTTAHLNIYYRNKNKIPFDLHLSYGKYLAGDEGGTIELSRSFLNGMKFGFFATFTNVTSEQFGEGSFDKGLFFKIPLYGNLINYTWRPLTKDPGQKLLRKDSLHDLLIKFEPIQ